jgi:hypothetical protein
MWVTAPGFYALERNWIMLHPGSTWWAQIPPLLIGIAAIPTIYLLARYFRIGTRTSLAVALIVSVCPASVTYSSRLKEYGADFLLTCLLLALGEAVRRRPRGRSLFWLSAASVVSFAVSASTAPVLVGVWLALGALALTSHQRLGRLVGAGLATALGCALVVGAFYRHLSPALHRGWLGFYVLPHSPGTLVSTLYAALTRLYGYMVGISISDPKGRVLLFAIVSALALLGLRRNRAMLAPALVLGSAILASALGVIPLGTDRTDEVLYPALLLLLASGVGPVRSLAARLVTATSARRAVRWTAISLFIIFLVVEGLSVNATYPGTDTRGLAADIAHDSRPGDHVVVSELMRYPWALYEDATVHLRFGSDWNSGFTVVSTQPGVFIVPSEFDEGGSTPATWAREMASYRRLWFVETAPLAASPTYRSLRADGWRPIRVIRATGCAAILLERP